MDTASLPSLDRPSPSPSLLTPPYHSASKLTASPVRYTHSNTKRSLMCSISPPPTLSPPSSPPPSSLLPLPTLHSAGFHLRQQSPSISSSVWPTPDTRVCNWRYSKPASRLRSPNCKDHFRWESGGRGCQSSCSLNYLTLEGRPSLRKCVISLRLILDCGSATLCI